MEWLFIALISPFLWAISNFIDKTLLTKHFKGGIGAMVIYSCLIGFPVAVIICLLKPEVLSIPFFMILFIILNSFLFISYLFPYLKALNKADTSTIIPLFQMVPVFSYLLALIVLGETLTGKQIIASLIIIFGAIGILTGFKKGKISIDKKVFLLMAIASLIVSLSYLFFKIFAIETTFWVVSFWQYVGFTIFGLLTLIFSKDYRAQFLISLKKNKVKIMTLNISNEVINIIAVVLFTYASVLAPISLVFTVNGLQPFFVFIIGVFLSLFMPHIMKEDLKKKVLLQKIFFIIVIFIGTYLLQSTL